MGTTWSIKYVDQHATIKKTVIQSYLNNFNRIASAYLKDSEISKINHAPVKTWLTISPSLEKILRIAHSVSQQTEGAFDITVGQAVNYWGFGAEQNATTPKPKHIGFEFVRIRRHQLYKEKNVYLDLSAIAKGYAVDQIAQLLKQKKIERYLVEIGGEIIAKGKNKQQQYWRVAIEAPNPLQRHVMQVISLKNQAIASSGSYRNFKQKDGKIISHTIDPKTAEPINHKIIATTVLSPSAAIADALATAFMVLPMEKSLMISRKKNIATLIITGEIGNPSSFKRHASPKFERLHDSENSSESTFDY